MNATSWLRSTVLAECDLRFSDERPLYAYHCRDALYQTMCKQLSGAMQSVGQKCYVDDQWDPMFCLYAAEWWQRNYESGPWSWDGIIQSLGWGHMLPQERSDRVTKGLKWWKRSVISRNGTNMYLVTIACEGGLPLRLLQGDNQYLGAYFKEILRERQLARESGIETTALAERLGHRLPASLQQSIVFELAGRLIDAVSRCRSLLGGADDHPLQQLDKIDPDWRAAFPLRLDDDVAQTLLIGLLKERVKSANVKSVASSELCVASRGLRRLSDAVWTPELTITLPDKLSSQALLSKLDVLVNIELPQRLEVKAQLGGKQYSLALLSRNTDETWRTQFPSGGHPFNIVGTNAFDPVEILISHGQKELGRWTPDGTVPPAADLPWCFISPISVIDENTKYVEWAGEGTVSTSDSVVLLVLPDGAELRSHSTGSHMPAGEIRNSDQRAIVATESVQVILPDGAHCSIELGAEVEDLPVYRIAGSRMHWEMHKFPIYTKMPRISQYVEDETFVGVSVNQLSWRPTARPRDPWRTVGEDTPLGDVRIRHNSERGVRFDTRLVVLPDRSQIIMQPKANQGGKIILQNFGSADIAVDTALVSGVEVTSDAAVTSITVGSTPLSLFNLPVQLDWPGNSSVRLQIPVPVEKSAVVGDDGVIVNFQSQIAIDELLGMRAVIVGSNVAEAEVDVEIIGQGQHRIISNICSVRIPMAAARDGQYSLQLGPLIPRLRRLMALSSQLDTTVRLTLLPGSLNNFVRVRNFQSRLWVEEGVLQLQSANSPGLQPGVEVEAISLLQPSTTELLPYDADKGGWDYQSLEPGLAPWIAAAWKESQLIGRPYFVPVAIEVGPQQAESLTDSALRGVLQLPDFNERNNAMAEMATEMAGDPSHIGWEYLKKSLIEYERYPLSSFDFVLRFIENPHALCMGLFCLHDEFELYFDIANHLNFDWRLLTLDAWVETAQVYHGYVRSMLPNDLQEMALSRTTEILDEVNSHIPEFDMFFNLLKGLLAGESIDNAQAVQFSMILELNLKDAVTELIQEKGADKWPDENQLPEWLEYEALELLSDFPAWGAVSAHSAQKAAVLRAPIDAGLQVCSDCFPASSQSSYYIAFREFEQNWFDSVIGQILVWGFLNRTWVTT